MAGASAGEMVDDKVAEKENRSAAKMAASTVSGKVDTKELFVVVKLGKL